MDTQNKDVVSDLLTYQYAPDQWRGAGDTTEQVLEKCAELTKLSLEKTQKEVVNRTSITFSEVAARLAEYYQ